MDAKELKSRLTEVELFAGLSKRALTTLVKAGREVVHTDGHEVIAEGAGAVGFHFITAGQARVTTAGTVRRTLSVGDYFGEISVIDGRPRSAAVEAVDGLVTFAIQPTAFRVVVQENPEFARQVLLLLCRRLREAEKRSA